MKHNILSSLMCLALLCGHTSTLSAQDIDTYDGYTSNPVAMKSNRPKLYSNIFGTDEDVTYYMQDGWLHIDFPVSEGLASLTIRTEDGRLATWRPFGTWKQFAYYLGEVQGTMYITVKTTAGCLYTGVLNPAPVYDGEPDWE